MFKGTGKQFTVTMYCATNNTKSEFQVVGYLVCQAIHVLKVCLIKGKRKKMLNGANEIRGKAESTERKFKVVTVEGEKKRKWNVEVINNKRKLAQMLGIFFRIFFSFKI